MTTDAHLGFLALLPTGNDDGYLGALLVLNTMGVPVEFRATFPVKPTLLQRTLYGESLEPYIGVELCGKPLLKSISHQLSLLIVNLAYLLPVRGGTDSPVLFLQRAGEAIEVTSAVTPNSSSTNAKPHLESKTGRFQPVTITVFDARPEDLEQARPMLEQVFAESDLLEPFDRVKLAVQTLQTQDKRFQ